MRNLTHLFLVLVFVATGLPAASALEIESDAKSAIEAEGSMARKLQRGFTNVVLAPVEFVQGVDDRDHKWSEWMPAWMFGFVKGSFYTARRAVVGVLEVGTFFIPIPSQYAPIIEPEFVWQLLEDAPKKS